MGKEESTPLSIRKQCEILQVSRSAIYRTPKGESQENLEIMRKMDQHHIDHPDEGVVGMRGMLRNMGYIVNTKRVRRFW